jgi:hypothetical protein
MTPTEAAMQAKLDDDPSLGWVRQVLADYLDEIGDERAMGYRVMGLLGVYPRKIGLEGFRMIGNWWWSSPGRLFPNCLPEMWNKFLITEPNDDKWEAPTRREVEDNAARAWLKLAPTHQEHILSQSTCPL